MPTLDSLILIIIFNVKI